MRIIERLYIHTLEKLDAAKTLIEERWQSNSQWRQGGIINVEDALENQRAFMPKINISALAKQSGTFLWLAKRAIKWRDRVTKYHRLIKNS